MTANAPLIPATPSARPNGGRVGGPSAGPHLVGEPGHRLGEGAERSPLGVRSELPEAADAQHDEVGVDLEQLVGSDVPAFHDAGPEVLDEHVGVFDEAAQDLLALGLGEVECDGPLVAGDHLRPQAVAVLVVAVGAGRVAVGVLDLDDVGAVVAEQHGGDRGGVDGAKVEDPDAGQGSGHGAAPCAEPPSADASGWVGGTLSTNSVV